MATTLPVTRPSIRADEARAKLVALLQLAHSGELAASLAYTGHAASVSNLAERIRIETIKAEELDHRARVRAMMDALGVEPDARRERKLRRIGRTISAFCHVGGWFGPMYGAARLERKNIGEYERAATYAIDAGFPEFVDDLIDMSSWSGSTRGSSARSASRTGCGGCSRAGTHRFRSTRFGIA